jgi:putative Tad-like protein involved in Flp pilus assembly
MPKGTSCVSGSAPNAVKVVNSTVVKTFLMGLFGVPTLKVGATATASMGPAANPWNVAIIIDSTGSMATTDSNCNTLTEFQCALTGTQALLESTNPCPNGVTSCSGSGSNVRVSLFTFPNVLTSYNGVSNNSLSDDINCSGTPATWTDYSAQPIAAPYTLPVPGATLPGTPNATSMTYTQTSTGKTWTATYQITPFLSDYYEPSAAGGLNSSSNLVKAVGVGSTKGCLTYTFGIWGTGSGSGFGNTYLPGAIYEAQAALVAEQTASAPNGGKNAIIILSDGQSNASYYSKNTSAYGTANSTNQYADAYEFPSGPAGSEVGPTSTSPADPVPAYYTPATTSSYGYSALTGTGVYPDWKDQCQQAMAAAQYATSKGTRVYSVAYGSESSGCNSGWNIGLTDTTLQSSVVSAANVSFTLSQVTPCLSMENIASSLTYFYSDYNQSGSGSTCQDNSHATETLNDIFQAIAATFTTPRLLPNNAT